MRKSGENIALWKGLLLLLTGIMILFTSSCQRQADKNMPKKIRQPWMAGSFYPAEAERLASKISEYLSAAGPAIAKNTAAVRAIIVPHAGYNYSASVAAHSYLAIRGQSYDNVFLICNSHSGFFNGIAVDDSDAWQTPLGSTEVNRELAVRMADLDKSIRFDSKVHLRDHTLEVQLPFLQSVLDGKFKIIPLLFGNLHEYGHGQLAAVLRSVMGEQDLLVISTDMSHYPEYEDANRLDNTTLELIAALDIAGLEHHVRATEAKNIPGEETLLCGIDGVKTAMEIAEKSGWQAEVLQYANSGDVEIGDKKRVVGYGAVVFRAQEPEKGQAAFEEAVSEESAGLSAGQKAMLLKIAKETVESYVKSGKIPDFDIADGRLSKREGAFVTLTKNGELRGCIGRFAPTDLPLWQIVREMAAAAAAADHRFSPVKEEELAELEYEVSVLSVPEKIGNWQEIVLGKHGVVVRKGVKSGVFLPQVADETGWDKEEFLSQLCWQKAGLPPGCYKNDKDVEILVFTANAFH